MATLPLNVGAGSAYCGSNCRNSALRCLLSLSRVTLQAVNYRKRLPRTIFVCCHQGIQTQDQQLELRRCSPFLENEFLSEDVGLASCDWKAVPDIWRTAAEKFSDRVALVDKYHRPPLELTYKQSSITGKEKRKYLCELIYERGPAKACGYIISGLRICSQYIRTSDLVIADAYYHDVPLNSPGYFRLEEQILDFAEGLRVVGIKPDEKISLFADNSCRWIIADQGIMATGAINVVRGSRSSVEELLQIYKHSESDALVVDDPDLFNRIAESFHSNARVKFIIFLWGDKLSMPREMLENLLVFNYREVIDLGRQSRTLLLDSHDARKQYTYEAISSDDIATLIYTSGTTGNPKGVMLTHRNLLHQIQNLWDIVPAAVGDRFLSMLPPWHAYERACEYYIFTRGAKQAYTTIKNLKEDLRNYQPHYLISVPLVYETLYSRIQKQITSSSAAQKFVVLTFIKISVAYMEYKRVYEGKCLSKNRKAQSFLVLVADLLWARTMALLLWPIHMLAGKLLYSKIRSAVGILKAGISGGGSFPLHLDRFFEAIGIQLQNGYGLTETSPVVAARRPEYNVLGSVGHPLKDTEVKIVDTETDEVLPLGSKGIVKIRGPQVMKGYYKNPSATKQAIDEDGWLSSGDLGWIAPHHSAGRSCLCGGVLVLEGRAKDTIVLSTGENVEPSELEEAATRSSLIEQIVIIGQDKRRLGALIVPNKEEALLAAKKLSIVNADTSELSKDTLTGLLYDELRTWTAGCSFQIGPIFIVDEPFTVDNGLMTPTLKVRRDRVAARYRDEIADLYK